MQCTLVRNSTKPESCVNLTGATVVESIRKLTRGNKCRVMLLTTYLSSSCRVAHKARTSSRQTPLSWALLAAVPQVNPAAFSSSSIVRRHVVFSLPLLLFLSGFQVSAVFAGRSLFIL